MPTSMYLGSMAMVWGEGDAEESDAETGVETASGSTDPSNMCRTMSLVVLYSAITSEHHTVRTYTPAAV